MCRKTARTDVCPERRARRCRRRQSEPGCAGDGGWPSGLAEQAGRPNHRKLRRSRAGVVSVAGKGLLLAGQVCDGKTNMCEPLLTHRNAERWHHNRGRSVAPGQRRVHGGVPSARRPPVCCPGGARCKGGVSPLQAPVWNRRTCRLDTDGQSKGVRFAPWPREGELQAAETASGRVPMRGTGADRLVVAMKAL